jgi:hypothetical protein
MNKMHQKLVQARLKAAKGSTSDQNRGSEGDLALSSQAGGAGGGVLDVGLQPYASVDSLEIIWIDVTDGRASANRTYGRDVSLSGLPNVSDGVYRQIDGEWLLWLRQRVEVALRNRKRKNSDEMTVLSQSVDFLQRVRAVAAGVGVIEAESLPQGYGRPVAVVGWDG